MNSTAGAMIVHWALDIMVPDDSIGEHAKKSQTTEQNNVVPLCGQYMRPQEVLQNLFATHSEVIMRWKPGAMVVYWALDNMVAKNRISDQRL